MPYWCIHFRVADHLLGRLQNTDETYFLIGNMAPDCGVPTKDGYDPPTDVTHFTVSDPYHKSDCDYLHIYNTYIKKESDFLKKSFFTGYFVHLMTDCLNAEYLIKPIERQYGSLKTEGNRAILLAVQAEWKNQDLEFFAQNTSPSYERFCTYKGFDEKYPVWYKKGEITRQMAVISALYQNPKPKKTDYLYTSKQLRDDFCKTAADEICDFLNKYGVL